MNASQAKNGADPVFASPNGEGLGRVTVNAPATQKVKVFLEGRYFGTAPITIYSVPKGDYIIEALPETGKQISKPVTVEMVFEALRRWIPARSATGVRVMSGGSA